MSGRSPGGNSTSTTGPMTRTMRPSLTAVCVLMVVLLSMSGCALQRVPAQSLEERASAPPTISVISVVICSWRAWFMMREREPATSLALSVAAFMAR
jgi:hypothetical protein